MPTGPASSSYIIPPLTLSDTFYEWYTLTNTEVIDKLNRLKVYQMRGATGITFIQQDDGVAVGYLDTVVPGDHTFTGNITFNGTVTTVNSNIVTIDDFNILLGATSSPVTNATITNSGGGGIIINGSPTAGDKYFLWKSFDPSTGRTFNAWRISDALAFTGDGIFYANTNCFEFREGSDDTPASKLIFETSSVGATVDIATYFASSGTTYNNIRMLNDGSTRLLDSSVIKRFTGVSGITAIGITFGSVVRHDLTTGGLTLAQANTVANAESLGIVVDNNITAQTVDVNILGYIKGNFSQAIASGDVPQNSLGTGEFYFLSPYQAGKITKTVPSTTGEVRKPILYALGSDRAMVMNYVGNKIVDVDSLYSRLNASTVIVQHEPGLFAVGDVARFEEGITGSGARQYGSYVKASNISPEKAEALGIISSINFGGNSGASLLTVSGFIDISASGITLIPGSVYFLGADEGKLTEDPPQTVNTVRKPMLVAVSPKAGLVQTYVGFMVGSDSGSQSSSLINATTIPYRNKLINGNFDIWQRGYTFDFLNPISGVSRYTTDRWKVMSNGGSTADRLNITIYKGPLSLGELSGSNVYSKNCLEMSIGTGGHLPSSFTYLMQRVEGIENLPTGYATVSFWAKASVSNAKLGVSFRRDFGGGTAPDYATTGVEKNSQKNPGTVFNLPTQWTKYSYTFVLPESKNGIVGASGNDGPEIRFFVRAGSDLVTGKDVFEELNPNISGVPNYKIYLAQVQLEAGPLVTPFEVSDRNTEFVRCKRYYQTTHPESELGLGNFSTNVSVGSVNDGHFMMLPLSVTFSRGNNIPLNSPFRAKNPISLNVTPILTTGQSFSVTQTRVSNNYLNITHAASPDNQYPIAYEVESEL